MKVALICNMNNMFFGLARYLRDRNIEAEVLLLNDEYPHFHPSYDTFDLSYQQYVRNLQWGSARSFATTRNTQVEADLAPYAVLIGCGTAPAFVNKIGRILDVFFPHGPDLYELPFLAETMRFDQRLRNRAAVNLFRRQAAGIREARCINQEKSHPSYRAILARLGVLEKTYYFGCPMVYTPQYRGACLNQARQRSAWFHEFRAIRQEHEVLVFNHARQVWRRRAGDFHLKASDVVMRGVKEAIVREPALRVGLVQFEYGEDVEASRSLVQDLGLERRVHWMPLMARKEIMLGLSIADFGCGQFGTGCIGGGTTWEVLAMGKPLLQWVDDDVNFVAFTQPYPFIRTKSPSDVATAILEFGKDSARRLALGDAGQRWYEDNFATRCVDVWCEFISAAERGVDLEGLSRQRAADQESTHGTARHDRV